MENNYENAAKRIPVTIVSGFLGAGKTTLINQILSQHKHLKFAIIENEFGKVGIDYQFIEAKSNPIIEINQGCICCSLNHNLVEALNELLSNYQFDHLIIETTGVAEPTGVAAPFLLYSIFKEKFELQNTIVLVDAFNLEDSLKDSDLPARQIAFADILLVNKIDLVTPEKVVEIDEILRSLNPDAEIIFCENAKLNSYKNLIKRNKNLLIFDENINVQNSGKHPYNSVCIEENLPLDILKFQNWMNMMLQIQSGRIYRVKGYVQFYGFDKPLWFQSVGKQFVMDKNQSFTDKNSTCLVFIGLGLETKKIQEIIKKLVYKS